MFKKYLPLLIVVFLLACDPNLKGEYKVTRVAFAPIYAEDDAVAKARIGKVAKYDGKTFTFEKEICTVTGIKMKSTSLDEYLVDSKMSSETLGINVKKIYKVETNCPIWFDNFIVTENHAIIFSLDGVYYFLEKDLK